MGNLAKTYGESKQDVIDRLWLTYFNDTLYAQGLITETQRNQMRVKISSRKSHAQNRDGMEEMGSR